ncbi:MAG: type I glutamate--ammonia ligase [Candidatus Krumholzibacteriota bacterium]|nr:type I glutamate--ammonia ligase [Candidatus Krumholzibacteriota bacterium]
MPSQAVERALALARKQKVEAVDLKFVNLFGGWHHITLPASRFDAGTFREGIAFDGASVPGFKSLEAGDMVLLPDPATAQLDGFWERPTLSLIAQPAEPGSHQPFAKDPRAILARAEGLLRELGIASASLWAPEFEFYIFDSVSYLSDINQSFYRIDSSEADWNSGVDDPDNLGYKIPRQGGYHAIPPLDQLYNLRAEMAARLEGAGIAVRYHHHEVGGPGQSEIEIMEMPARPMADAAMRVKYIIKMVARRHGKSVTFMPKPLYNEAGSGMHFHQRLVRGRRNLFWDRRGYAGLSKRALNYIGGLLLHAPALLAFTNPSTNSYKRLVPGFEAPVKTIFGLANRSAAVRIPQYADTAATKRMEFRPPDATCNIYLAMAAQLLAGIDGIQRGLDPVDLGFGPYDQNVFEMPEAEKARLGSLPTSLREAMVALQRDHQFLLAGGVFSQDLIEYWIETKIEKEYNEVRNRPHPYEISLYYNA